MYPRHFNAFKTWLIIIDTIRNLYPDKFRWIEPSDPNQPYHFDRLLGIPKFRDQKSFTRELKKDSSLISYTKLWDNLTLYNVRNRRKSWMSQIQHFFKRM